MWAFYLISVLFWCWLISLNMHIRLSKWMYDMTWLTDNFRDYSSPVLRGASSGSGGRNKSRPSNVSVRESCKALQIVQGCHNTYVPLLGFNTCQTIIRTTRTTGNGSTDSLYPEAPVGTVVYFGEEETVLVRLRCKLSSDSVDSPFVHYTLAVMLIVRCLVLGYPHSDCEDAFNGCSLECSIGSPRETR